MVRQDQRVFQDGGPAWSRESMPHQASVERVLTETWAKLGDVGQLMVLFGGQRTWTIFLEPGGLRTHITDTNCKILPTIPGRERRSPSHAEEPSTVLEEAQAAGVRVSLGNLGSYPSWEGSSELLLGRASAPIPAPHLSPPSAPGKDSADRLT